MRANKILLHLIAASALLLAATACSDEETEIGDALQDPSTIYEGILDTIQGNDIYAVTLYEDSLRTSGYTTGMLGKYSDATFGMVSADIYSQLALTTAGLDLSADGYTIDSVVLYLTVSDCYPDTLQSHNLHLSIRQLDETFNADSGHAYYAFDQMASSTTFCDTSIRYTHSGNSHVLRLKLNDAIAPLLKQRYAGQNDFQSTVKGIHITTLSDSDPMLLTINFASSTTLMKAYYSLSQDGTQGHDTVNFIVGCASNNSTYIHFCHFAHTYGASPIAPLFNGSTDSLDGSTKLYLEPMGGTYIYLNIDKYIKTFHQQHPNAVINYAELLLPTADDADTLYPELISAYKRYSNGYVMAISDNNYLVRPYSYTGYDGTYHPEYKSYRLRISQYMQELLRDNADHGMMLYINGRRSSGQRTIINGPLSSRPLRIAFIYSE